MIYSIYIVMGLLLWPLSGGATTVKSFAFDGLCETAQAIVHVRCLEKQSRIMPDREGVFTQFRFAVIDVIKGTTEDEIALVLPGGNFNGQHTEVPGMPQFVPGQETVLFLSEKDDYGSPWPVGLGQGCYGVTVGSNGIRQVVFERHNPIDPTLRTKPIVQTKVSLKTFMDTIRGIIKIEAIDKNQTQ
jgi:hypothetical protein